MKIGKQTYRSIDQCTQVGRYKAKKIDRKVEVRKEKEKTVEIEKMISSSLAAAVLCAPFLDIFLPRFSLFLSFEKLLPSVESPRE